MSLKRKPITGNIAGASADWRPERVIYELHLRGLSLRQLGFRHGLHGRSLPNALRKRWPRAEAIIAESLSVHPRVIWPSRYSSRRIGAKR
jgi:Ner family transcriptional regulator